MKHTLPPRKQKPVCPHCEPDSVYGRYVTCDECAKRLAAGMEVKP